MARPDRSLQRHGFAIVELGAMIVVGMAVVVLLVLACDRTRRSGRLGHDIANLRLFGVVTWAYGADNQDRMWSFSWQKGQNLSQWPDLNNATTDVQAQANQAVDILRRRADRLDINWITEWIPNVFYSHLVLADYDGRRLPDLAAVSAADLVRLLWARDPHGFDAGHYQPAPSVSPPGTNSGKRWPYCASFIVPLAFFDQSPAGSRMAQGTTHSMFFVPGAVLLRGMNLSKVAFPSQKVLMHDQMARHFPPYASYFAFAESRLSPLFLDGSVSVRATGDANPGWQPNTPASPNPTTFNYHPDTWEPPTPRGQPSEQVIGRYRWTRGGIEGRDFGGPEVCTGQPGCNP